MGNSIIYKRPSELYYTHDSISFKFTDGHFLDETFETLLYGKSNLSVETMPPIEVMTHQGKVFVVRGNRRLYILKKLESIGVIGKVKCLVKNYDGFVFKQQCTTRNGGTSVDIRGSRTYVMEERLDRIVEKWKKEERGFCLIM